MIRSVKDRNVGLCPANLSVSFVHVLTNCCDADIARTALDEENDRRDAQVNCDGEEDAGKNNACHHRVWSASGNPAVNYTAAKSEEVACCVVWEGGVTCFQILL